MNADLLERARREGTPLIDGGTTVTFVWLGPSAPRLYADFNGWDNGEGTALTPAGDGLWTHTMQLPADAYVEYAFIDPASKERVEDAFNRRKVGNGMGKHNHYFSMPEARLDTHVRPRRGVKRGKLTSEVLNGEVFVTGGKRKVYFYQPAVEEPCPLLVVWDGQDYARRAHLPTVIDNLIHEGRMRPVALAMPEHGRAARMLEYGCSEMVLGFVTEIVIPAARQRLNLIDPAQNPGSYGIMGASMGGLMALYAGLLMPQLFGRVLAQSGAFAFPGHEFIVWDMVRCKDLPESKFWLDVGTMEFLLDCNRRMAELLEQRGYAFAYHEYNGGHNYTAWRSDFIEGLEYLFPPE